MNRRKPEAYPDISDILARKAEGRREIAGRSFGEKIALVERLREQLAALKRAREQRCEAEGSRGPAWTGAFLRRSNSVMSFGDSMPRTTSGIVC